MQEHQENYKLQQRLAKITQMGDPLETLNAQIDWEAFRPDLLKLRDKPCKSAAGAKPLDEVLKFKMLVLQHLYNLSDDALEYYVRDRLSFMRFLGLQLEDRVPDAKTIWLFREQLKNKGLIDQLFARFHEQITRHGYAARKGQMIDATFVEAPRQRNSREENAQIKAGETPQNWSKNKARQKDVDARWTKKNKENHYGYKNHINADEQHKLIQTYAVTDAAVHDSQIFDEFLDHSLQHSGQEDAQKRPIYADSAYRSLAREAELAEQNFRSEICEKGARNHPLTDEQKASNRCKSKVRARVEHIFGTQAQMGGHVIRTIGLARAKAKIGLMNLVYNMKRLCQLIARDTKQRSPLAQGSGAPNMA